jgi:hypothetical protein
MTTKQGRTVSLVAAAVISMIAAGCDDDAAPQFDVSGAWSYDWQVRDAGDPWPNWDGHFRGTMTLSQDGADVSGMLGYPDEDPLTLFTDERTRDAYEWPLYGVIDGGELHLWMPKDEQHVFRVVVTGAAMGGRDYGGGDLAQRLTFSATRCSSLQ